MPAAENFDVQSLIRRDHLAIERTVLANERTLLSYIRTGLTLFISGVALIKLFNTGVFIVIGWAFIVGASLIILIGQRRYRIMKRWIASAKRDQPPVSEEKSAVE